MGAKSCCPQKKCDTFYRLIDLPTKCVMLQNYSYFNLQPILYSRKSRKIGVVSHQWCDLFYRLLHSYTRHAERVVRGERDTVLSAQE